MNKYFSVGFFFLIFSFVIYLPHLHFDSLAMVFSQVSLLTYNLEIGDVVLTKNDENNKDSKENK